jgi:hypothetical protein
MIPIFDDFTQLHVQAFDGGADHSLISSPGIRKTGSYEFREALNKSSLSGLLLKSGHGPMGPAKRGPGSGAVQETASAVVSGPSSPATGSLPLS